MWWSLSCGFQSRSVEMAMARSSMDVAIVVLTMLVMGAAAATPSPPNCDSAASALMPCYSYVTGSDVAKPPTDCCGGLDSLNTNSPACLCQLITQLKGSAASQPSVNITKALYLPKDCAIILNTSDCPALANLPLSPPAGTTPPSITSPSTPVPTTASPGPTAAGPEISLVPGNDVLMLLPTGWIVVVNIAALGVQALL